MSTIEEFEEWLEKPQYETVWPDDRVHTNEQFNVQLRTLELGTDALLNAAKGQDVVLEIPFKTHSGGIAFIAKFRLTDVEITKVCQEHTWGEWSYDYMGGDIRTCSTCGEKELV